MSFIEDQLSRNGDFLLGELSESDGHAYMNPWFVAKFVPETGTRLLAEFPLVRAWMQRIEALGYGTHAEMSREEAVKIARISTPATKETLDPHDPDGFTPGSWLGTEPVAGGVGW